MSSEGARQSRPTLPSSFTSPPAVEEHPTWLLPDAHTTMLSAGAFVRDPYGGIPRREDYDPYNTARRPPPHSHGDDMQATYRTFRDVVLSTQSWGVQWTEATDTSVKRWVHRALKNPDVEDHSCLSVWSSSAARAASTDGPDIACVEQECRETPPSILPIKSPPTSQQKHFPTEQRRQQEHLAQDKSF